MRIGILTFHRAHNYGAMLQAYALKHVLHNMGHDVEFISYRQPKIEDAYKSWSWKYDSLLSIASNFKNFVSSIIMLPRKIKRRNAFMQFASRYLPESRGYDKKELLQVYLNYDAVFFGSDQIWTTRFLGEFDDVLWGDIKLNFGRKIAYAPSMELKNVSDVEKDYIREHIKNFAFVSAREFHMSNLLESITGMIVPTVVDPTLLCTQRDYATFVETSKNVPSYDYVLVYQVGHRSLVDEIAQKVAAQLNCPIIDIGSKVLLHNKETYKDDYGPADFVSLIANATFIVSCSFHGTAFSVNFRKPFYSVLIEGLDSRTTSLLVQLGLTKYGIRTVDEVDAVSAMKIDYASADIALQNLREKSLLYIEKSLS